MSEHVRAEQIALVLTGTTPEWREHCKGLLKTCADSRVPFSAVDLRKMGLEIPAEARSISAVFSNAARAGTIKPTGRYVVNPFAKNGTSIREWIGV